MTLIMAIVFLGIVIFVHEFGHFISAKIVGVRVLKFSLGFGPRIAGFRYKETEYLISMVPLGGYVKMLGEEPGSELSEDEKRYSFSHKPVSKRAIIVFSGPFFNLLFACIVFFFVFIHGVPVLTPTIGEVMEGSSAFSAGLKKGDLVVAVNDREIKEWNELQSIVQKSPGKELNLRIKRGEEMLSVKVTPKKTKIKNIFNEEVEVGLIGIKPEAETFIKRLNPHQALYFSVIKTGEVSYLTILSIIKLIQRVIPIETLGGPLMIFDIAKKSAEAGFIDFFLFMALISVNLGILNLLPVPVLDGGHLLFFTIEKLRGKPLNEKTISVLQRIGIFILITLMIIAFRNDIMRLFTDKVPE